MDVVFSMFHLAVILARAQSLKILLKCIKDSEDIRKVCSRPVDVTPKDVLQGIELGQRKEVSNQYFSI